LKVVEMRVLRRISGAKGFHKRVKNITNRAAVEC
jgi:hypothetical protein